MKFFKQVEIWKIWQLNNFVYFLERNNLSSILHAKIGKKYVPETLLARPRLVLNPNIES